MKTKIRAVPLSQPASLFDAILLLIAGAALEAQTHGEIKPFGLQRRTLRALAARTGH